MQGLVSDKTFHLKWNNHLQNLSQLFTTIYSSSALADVTLSCRDGTLKAHKLVLSACSPYFEQIFKDNPCQHPIVILKGIPFSEINLLVEFMYKGSVDVQELDLQSLMHTASELEIRGLAYEARDNAAQLLNVNLEYPSYTQTTATATQPAYQQPRTDVERLKQIHMYQQSMMRAEEIRRRRQDDPTRTHTAVNNILAAAAREMEEARHAARSSDRPVVSIQTEQDQQAHTATSTTTEVKRDPSEDERPKKRVSILSPEDEKLRVRKKPMTVRFQDEAKYDDRERSRLTSPGPANNDDKPPGIKVVQLAVLQKPTNNDHEDSDEKLGNKDDDEETDSSGSMSDAADYDSARPHVCKVCDLRFQRSSHLNRHRLTHTGERPFTCGGCGRSFARSDKLRVHTKICEREDPTVDMANDSTPKRETNSEVMSGMVRTTHRESGHLVFTPSGDVMLPPRATPSQSPMNASMDSSRNDISGDMLDPPRRGRGRPRKTPLPMTPKIKKRRGRPPKTSLGKLHLVLTPSGNVMLPPRATPLQSFMNASLDSSRNYISGDMMDPPRRGRGRPRKTPLPMTSKIKKRRGRPPKTSLGKLHLVLTPSGNVMLPPRATPSQSPMNALLESSRNDMSGDMLGPPRCGRARPRKTPLPMTPKIKKRRGRPPKTSLGNLHLGFTPTGDVMLPPRATPLQSFMNASLDSSRNYISRDMMDPPRRGRGRPRKTPLPMTPKIKKRRGRPPKTSLGKLHLVLTPSGNVMLPPRATPSQSPMNALLESSRNDISGDMLDLLRRGRGRPRKTLLPMTLKIKKRRGRPPKTSLDMEGCVLTSGTVAPAHPAAASLAAAAAAGQQLLLKRKRGRPPKNYFLPRQGMDLDMPIPIEYGLAAELNKFYGRPNENYNATNLPFGDFSYLTDMIYNPMAYNYGVTSVDPDRGVDAEHSAAQEAAHDRTIVDVSDSSSEDEDSRVEPEENVPPVAMETQIMTVGDCQIVKLPANNDDKDEKSDQSAESTTVTSSTNSAVTITPITTVGDCTIRPVENA